MFEKNHRENTTTPQQVTFGCVIERMATIERFGRRWPLTGAVAVLAIHAIFGLGCRDPQEAAEPGEPALDEGLFGDSYQIVTNGLPEDAPALAAETLEVNISYTGGCEDHRFDVEYESERDTTTIWIRHRNQGDRCEEDVFDRLEFPLPEEALDMNTILLLNPNHDEPFVLRWGTPSPFDTIGF